MFGSRRPTKIIGLKANRSSEGANPSHHRAGRLRLRQGPVPTYGLSTALAKLLSLGAVGTSLGAPWRILRAAPLPLRRGYGGAYAERH